MIDHARMSTDVDLYRRKLATHPRKLTKLEKVQ